MADDLDELLDEVELKFCRNVAVTSPSPSDIKETKRKTEGNSGTYCSTNQVAHKSFDEDDIDSLLEDLLDDGDPLDLDMPKATKSDCKSSPSQPEGRRCCPVFLGGSSVASGVGTSTSQRISSSSHRFGRVKTVTHLLRKTHGRQPVSFYTAALSHVCIVESEGDISYRGCLLHP